MEILDLVKILWKRKWIILVATFLAIVISYFIQMQLPRKYKSIAQLATGFTTNDPLKVEEQRFNSYESNLKFNNLIEMLNSRLIISFVSYNLMLHDMTSEEPFRVVNLTDVEGIGNLSTSEIERAKEIFAEKIESNSLLNSFSEEEKKLINLLRAYKYDYESIQDNLKIYRLNLSDFIAIEYISENPLLSAYLVNNISDEFISYNQSLESNRSGQSVEFYSNQVAETKQVLEEKRETLQKYKSSNNVLNFDLESDSKVKQISELEAAREAEREKIYGLKLSIQGIDEQLAEFENGKNTANQNIVKYRNDINALKRRYDRSGSADQALLDSIDELRSKLQAEMAQASLIANPDEIRELEAQRRQFRIDLSVAQSSLSSINNRLNELNSNVSVFATREATISQLEREIQEASDLYQKALERYNTAKNSSMISNGSIRQVLTGQPAGEPESAKILLISALSGAVTFAMCVAIILGFALLDNSLKSPAYFKKVTGLPLIGQLNYLPNKKINFADIFKSPNGSYDMQKFNHLLKKLRFEIVSSGRNVFLITSTKEGEGKTFTIASVAYSLSLTNRKILLIDTNFKNNSLTKLFLSRPKEQKRLEEHAVIQNRENEIALLSHENSTKNDEDDFYSKGLVSKTMLKGIDIIGSKGGNYSPSEIFSKKNFQFLIEELSFKYDYIFMEGTSLNEYSDSKELVEYADGVIPVFSSFSEIKSVDRESIDFLLSLDEKLIGGILNNVKIDDMG